MRGEPPLRRIVLVGFMGAGKTAVGRALARALAWEPLDLDRWVEDRAGRTVAEIFAREGEGAFRALEAEATRAAEPRSRVVISTGGGWAANPALWAMLRPASWYAWLRVRPETALRRLSRGGPARPLLAGPEPLERARALLAGREPAYAAADWALDTDDLTPATAAARLREEIRARILPA